MIGCGGTIRHHAAWSELRGSNVEMVRSETVVGSMPAKLSTKVVCANMGTGGSTCHSAVTVQRGRPQRAELRVTETGLVRRVNLFPRRRLPELVGDRSVCWW